MKAQDEADRLWTPGDLAARWRCSVAVTMDRVRTKAVPFLWLGAGEARLTGRGGKLVRFRPKAVEAWEAKQEGYWGAETPAPAAPRLAPAAGLMRGRRAKQPGGAA